MARPRAAGYDAQREQILRSAAGLFARQGYAGTSMSAVAEACGLSKAALYHYVSDKQALLAQIALEHVGRLQGLVAEVERETPIGEPRLRALITRFMRAYADAQDAHRVLTEDVKFLDGAEQAQVLAGQRRVVAVFADAVAAARPGAREVALHTPLAMLLFGMMNWTFTWLQRDGELDHEQVGALVADLFAAGLPAVQLPTPSAAQTTRRRPRLEKAA